jgi:hypothetical protein
MAPDNRPLMVDLEERFAKDKDKVELNKLLAELNGYAAQAKKAIDAGLPPQEFRAVTKYRTALEHASEAATLAWAATVRP